MSAARQSWFRKHTYSPLGFCLLPPRKSLQDSSTRTCKMGGSGVIVGVGVGVGLGLATSGRYSWPSRPTARPDDERAVPRRYAANAPDAMDTKAQTARRQGTARYPNPTSRSNALFAREGHWRRQSAHDWGRPDYDLTFNRAKLTDAANSMRPRLVRQVCASAISA